MIRLSLCMIVKNEEAVLTRVLASAIQFADEILVADTGSTDRTVEIARQYTKHIYHYPWNDDFAAARNFICEKVSTEYWMGLDADDIVPAESITAILKLKETLSKSPQPDVVMMKYVAGFQPDGTSAFTYNRERILRTDRHFRWKGRVHEAIAPRGRILYSPIQIEHRKPASALTHSDRNLKIYETMLADGELLDPRHQYYYARELIDHKQYEKARPVLEHFLNEPAGWYENKIDACFVLGQCYRKMREQKNALEAFLYSLTMDVPRAEICCEVGGIFLERELHRQAAYWYGQALTVPTDKKKGGFFMEDKQKINCTVESCVYNNLNNHKCTLKEIQVTPIAGCNTKEPDESMCSSYKFEK